MGMSEFMEHSIIIILIVTSEAQPGKLGNWLRYFRKRCKLHLWQSRVIQFLETVFPGWVQVIV